MTNGQNNMNQSSTPRRRAVVALAACLVTACLACSASAQNVLDDGRIDNAVRRGVGFLYRRPTNQPLGGRYEPTAPAAAEGLAALAALESGERANKRELTLLVNRLHTSRADAVKSRALRLWVYSHMPAGPVLDRMRQDVDWLVAQQQESGGWGFGPNHPATPIRPDWTDSENTTLAVLALDAAATAGVAAPAEVWKKSAAWLTRSQNADGGWGYDPTWQSSMSLRPTSYGTATASALAAMHVLALRLAQTQQDAADLAQAARKGRQWLTQQPKADAVPGWTWQGDGQPESYLWLASLYAAQTGPLALAGSSANETVVSLLLASQQRDGGWGKDNEPAEDRTLATAWALLALSNARRPLLVNYLSLSATPWPTDGLAAFTRLYSLQHNRPLGWQQVGSADMPKALAQAPLLVLAADANSTLPAALRTALKDFFARGGIILVQSVGPQPAQGLLDQFAQAMPALEPLTLEDSHGLWSAVAPVDKDKRPAVKALGDLLGVRVILLPGDFAANLAADADAKGPAAMMLNVVALATDGRIGTVRYNATLAAAIQPTGPALEVARLKGAQGWDACPDAFEPLGKVMGEALSVSVREMTSVDLKAPMTSRPLLWLTAQQLPNLDAAQQANLRSFLDSGGTLFIDAITGQKDFTPAAQAWTKRTLGVELTPLEPGDPLLTGAVAGNAGSDISRVAYSRAVVAENKDLNTPQLLGAKIKGRWAVIASPYAVTCPMKGLPVWGIRGLSTPDARRLAANVLLHAAMTE